MSLKATLFGYKAASVNFLTCSKIQSQPIQIGSTYSNRKLSYFSFPSSVTLPLNILIVSSNMATGAIRERDATETTWIKYEFGSI